MATTIYGASDDLGRSCAAVADVLRQAGHEDLARQFDLAASRQKRAS